MNHCRDCNSDYATPGTCNCFAVGGKRHVGPYAPYVPYPYVPSVTTVYPWVQPWQPTVTWDGSSFGMTLKGPVTSDTVTYNADNVPRSFTSEGSC